MNVSWGESLGCGVGDSRLESVEAVKRRMEIWQKELNINKVFWRVFGAIELTSNGDWRSRFKGKYVSIFKPPKKIGWNDFDIIPPMVHSMGMQAYLYTWLFDEGWPLPPKGSYHSEANKRASSQTAFSAEHPEYARVDRTGKKRQWGVLSLSYPEVRAHFQNRYLELLKDTDYDGLFVCLRSQSQPADFADQYEFNEPVRKDFLCRSGRDILKEDFDLRLWRDLLGDYLTLFIEELRERLTIRNIKLAVGVPIGDILGPPMGNTTLKWREWVREGLIDDLIINQNSSVCPSMWHDLWPMHRGYGYMQNYIDNHNLSSLPMYIKSSYAPVFERSLVELHVSQQWDYRDKYKEDLLTDIACVDGLVLSATRYDNSESVKSGIWKSTKPQLAISAIQTR